MEKTIIHRRFAAQTVIDHGGLVVGVVGDVGQVAHQIVPFNRQSGSGSAETIRIMSLFYSNGGIQAWRKISWFQPPGKSGAFL